MNKKIIFFLINLCILLSIFIVVSKNFILKSKDNPHSVTLEIKPEYTNYLLGQSLWLNCKIFNNSEDIYYYKGFDITGIYFFIKDEGGNRVYGGVQVNKWFTDSLKILPKQEFETDINMDFYTIHIDKPGKYTIYAEYQDLKSNTIEINITKPTGDEAEVLNAYNYSHSGGSLEEMHKQINLLEEELNKHPSSVYAPQIINLLLLIHTDFGDISKVPDLMNKFLQYHANSWEMNFIMDIYGNYLGNQLKLPKEEIENRLRNIANTYKGTKSEQIINEFIEKEVNQNK